MTYFRNNIFSLAIIVMVLTLFSACAEEQVDMPAGKLHLSIGQVSSDLHTRAIPAELPKPVAKNFNVREIGRASCRERVFV